MAGLRFADIRFRPTEFLDFTSLTVEEFEILMAALVRGYILGCIWDGWMARLMPGR